MDPRRPAFATNAAEATPSAPPADKTAWIHALILFAVTAGLAFATLTAPREAGHISPVWPINAVALVALLRNRRKAWPLLIAAFVLAGTVVNVALKSPIAGAGVLALFNAGEVLICAVVLRARFGDDLDLSRYADLMIFALVAGLAAPVVAGLVAADWLHWHSGRDFQSTFLVWATGHGLGFIILTPALLAALDARRDLAERPITAIAVGAWVALCLLTVAVFVQSQLSLAFLVLPVLLFLTIHAERLGAVIGVSTVAVISIGLGYAGPAGRVAVGADWTSHLLVLQAFLAVCTAISLPLAALHKQWRQTRRSLAEAAEEARDQSRRATMAEAVSGVGHWRMDRATGQMAWSENVSQIFGLPPGQAPTFAQAVAMVHPDDKGANTRRVARALAGETVPDEVTRLIRSDGEIRYVSGRIVSERGPDGAVQGLFGTMIDITPQKRAAVAIAESEARFRRLADNVTDIVATYRVDGSILYVSPSIFPILGYRPDELIGQTTRVIVHPDDLADVMAQFRAYVTAGPGAPPPHIEYRAIAKDGRVLNLEAHPKAIYDNHGMVIELQDVVRDVTAREAMLAELETAREAAEAAAKVKAEFLANMSHELRTPLTSILGFTRLAVEQPGLTGVLRGYIDRVADASNALLCTVNDILDFSKVEAGQVTIRPEPFSPCRLGRSTLDLFLPQAAAKDIVLTLDCDMDEDAAVHADPDRVRQIVLNLVGNAVKFTADGQVTLRLRHVDGALLTEVIDTGEGIAPEAAARLFRRFSQVDGSSTRAHSGTGLGLAICKGLAEAMGGVIGVDSTPGAGSRFWFGIPAPAARIAHIPDADLDSPTSPSAIVRGARILVADDHPANRELARMFLGAIGAQVTEAVDGADAVALARAWPFDVILMDMRMPIMNGIEAAAAIRADGPNDGTPILAFTANADDYAAEHFLAAGFDGVVAKPLDANALIATIVAALTPFDPANESRQAHGD